MRFRTLTLALVAVMLAGCATTPFEPAMDRLIGKHIDEAIRDLGLPDEDAVLAGHRVISWYDSQACRVRVEVGDDLVIRRWDHRGKRPACARFFDRRTAAHDHALGAEAAKECGTTPDRWSKHCLLRKTR